ncbi:MAG: sulfotransferase [Anaerolineae bacterium]|nr:sulfotransferase [Anaerolineae bacterium]
MDPLFLFSLPRSGSTFCQRILAAHSDISTVNEPHFLLPFLFSNKDWAVRSTYNHHYASFAVQDFCNTLPNGEEDYLNEIKELALRLYHKSAPEQGGRYFLDKTPKYHFIVEDIIKLFPEGKFIFLWRHPLSVVASIMQTWRAGGWNTFHFDVDLYQGIDQLIRAYIENQNEVCAIRYEDVVLEPEKTWKYVFEYLDLPFEPEILDNFSEIKLEGRVTDPNSKKEAYQSIQEAPLHKWKQIMSNPLRKSWSRRYLKWLGEERLAIMGYKLQDLLAEVDALPTNSNHFMTDLYRMPLGSAYHLFELQLMGRKYKKWRSGERFYLHY